MDVSSVPQSSASSASVGDAPSQAVATRTSETYKEQPVLVHATPPLLSTTSHRLAPNLDGPHSPSARQAIRSSSISTPTAARTSSSSLSVTTPPASRHGHQAFDCTSALDGSSRSSKFVEFHTSQPLTPPASAASKRRRHWNASKSSPLRSDRSFPPTPFSRSRPVGRSALHRDSLLPESPTLQTQRARKLHRSSASTASLVLQQTSTTRERAAFTMSSFTAAAQLGARQDSREVLSPARVENTPTTIPPFIKSRALTLDYFDRPTLPPLVGPVRTSRSSSLSWSRYGSEHRSNPYYVSDLARRQSYSYTRQAPLTPTSLPGAGRPSSSLHGPWTPTSSVRSTSNELPAAAVAALHDRSIGTASRSGGSYFHLGNVAFRAPTAETLSSHELPSPNALGLFVEPSPLPAGLFRLDTNRARNGFGAPQVEGTEPDHAERYAVRPPLPRSNASAHLGSLARSPLSPNEEPLPRLSLGHRRSLDDHGQQLARYLPSLSLHSPTTKLLPVSPDGSRDLGTERADEFLYKMPILRNMSPLPDMSSESEDDDVDVDEGSGGGAAPSVGQLNGDDPASIADVPKEGSTGEIFGETHSCLPLVIEQERGSARKELYCKLDCTTHQCFSVVDGKWACYRRNYLKVDVAFRLEDADGHTHEAALGDLICQPAGRDAFRAERFAVHMSAHVLNKDGKLVKGRQGQVPLIQFGPARERGPREAVQPVALCSGGSLTPDAGVNEQMASRLGSIAAFRRVQIRSATLNNGQRGSAGQQFYALKLTLLAFPRHGPLTTAAGVEVACLTSHPITVRGRSKVHYAPNPAAAVRRRNQARPSTSSAGTRKGTSQSPRRLGSVTPATAGGSWTQAGMSEALVDLHAYVGYGENRRSTRLLRVTTSTSSGSTSSSSSGRATPCASSRSSRIMDISSIV